MMKNDYIPFPSKILEVIRHTKIEYTFRMEFQGDVKPGQFFEVSIPKYGEAPISVSGIGDNFVDLTIRRVGKVTNEDFEHYVGDLFCCVVPMGMDSMYQTMQVRTSSSWLAELVYRLFEEWWITFSIIQSSGGI